MHVSPDIDRPISVLSSGEVHVRQLEAILRDAVRQSDIAKANNREELEIAGRIADMINGEADKDGARRSDIAKIRVDALKRRTALEEYAGSNEELEVAERLEKMINEAADDAIAQRPADRKALEVPVRNNLPRLAELQRKYLDGDARAVEHVIYSALARLRDPDAFPFDVRVQWNSESRVAVVEYLLPNFDEISIIKNKVGTKTTVAVSVSKKERRDLVNDVPYALAIRALHAVVNVDEAKHVAGVAFNGILRFTDPATGHVRTQCLMSVMATRVQIEALQIDKVVSRECFLALKGLAAPQLADRVPVPPIVQFNREDSRIIESRDVFSEVDAQTNLATMDWMDFEHFIRQLFEKEFGRDGVEVKVTQSSRDRGVDAIAFDPDPIRGGKIVIQAKRYTRLVDVSAVRDLYGTVMNEGANKGILVTTSSFGKDSWEFAKDKPLTLLDGGNLLHLLQKHGQRFRIDLAEARRLQTLQPKSDK